MDESYIEKDTLLTAKEVAQITKVSLRTVREWVRSGRICIVQPGARKYFITRRDLDQFIAERRQRRQPKKPQSDRTAAE